VQQCCRDNLRSIDILGRVGGEEFLIVLPETGEKDALLIADRIRKAIKDLMIYINPEVIIRVTVSIGIAIFDSDIELCSNNGNPAEKFYARSDAAMYEAKKLGRDQVCMWEPRLG
jgi:diguanylate cyclase (GGDEF)-like protein